MLQIVSSQINYSQCIGLVEMALSYSPHALVLSNELAGLVRFIQKGIKTDDDHLALDLLTKVGPGGTFLGEKHTAIHGRTEIWPNKYFKSVNYEQWEREGKEDLFNRIDKDLKRILETYQPEPLLDSFSREIYEISKKYSNE